MTEAPLIAPAAQTPRASAPRGAWLAAAVWLGLLLAIEVARPSTPARALPPTCAFRAVTGIPCPTCGATRAVTSLARADVATAIAANPLLAAIAAGAALLLAFRIATRRWPTRPRWVRPGRLWLVAAALLLLNWAYLIATDTGN